MTVPALGSVVHSFFVDYLPVQKGLRPASVRSYRDVVRLFLIFAASQAHRKNHASGPGGPLLRVCPEVPVVG